MKPYHQEVVGAIELLRDSQQLLCHPYRFGEAAGKIKRVHQILGQFCHESRDVVRAWTLLYEIAAAPDPQAAEAASGAIEAAIERLNAYLGDSQKSNTPPQR